MNSEIERLQAIIAQQDRQITLLVDRLDKASASIAANKVNALAMFKAQTTIENLTHWLQWALNTLTSEPPHGMKPCKPKYDWCYNWDQAIKAAWPKQD